MNLKFEYKVIRFDDEHGKFEVINQSPDIRSMKNIDDVIFETSGEWKILSVNVPEVDPDTRQIYIKGNWKDDFVNSDLFEIEWMDEVEQALKEFKRFIERNLIKIDDKLFRI